MARLAASLFDRRHVHHLGVSMKRSTWAHAQAHAARSRLDFSDIEGHPSSSISSYTLLSRRTSAPKLGEDPLSDSRSRTDWHLCSSLHDEKDPPFVTESMALAMRRLTAASLSAGFASSQAHFEPVHARSPACFSFGFVAAYPPVRLQRVVMRHPLRL